MHASLGRRHRHKGSQTKSKIEYCMQPCWTMEKLQTTVQLYNGIHCLAFADERHRLQLQHTIAACVGRALGQWCRCSLWIDQNGLPCGFASRMQHAAASPQAIAPSLTARRRYAGCYGRKCKLGRGRTQERDRERTREHKPCNPACGAIGLHAQRAARLRRAGLQGA